MFCHHLTRRNLPVGSLLRVVSDIELKADPDPGTLLFVRQAQCVLSCESPVHLLQVLLNSSWEETIRPKLHSGQCADGQGTLLGTPSFLEQEYTNFMVIWASRLWPEMSCQQSPSSQSSLIPNWSPAQGFLYLKEYRIRGSQVLYSFFKDDFFS